MNGCGGKIPLGFFVFLFFLVFLFEVPILFYEEKTRMTHTRLALYSLNNMRHRKLRSWLTILGVIIGIASIVVLISLAQGLDGKIRTELQAIGTNYIIVVPGNPFAGGFRFGPPVFKGALLESDADAIRRIPGVKSASAGVFLATADVEYKGQNVSTAVIGIEPAAMSDFITIGYESGKFFREGDGGAAVIGHGIAAGFFKEDVEYGKTLSINGHPFKVKGIIKEGGGASPYDSIIYIDKDAAQALVGEAGSRKIDRIIVIGRDGANMQKLEEKVNAELIKRHKVRKDEKDFSTITSETISKGIAQITGLLSIFLGGIAAISLIVGAIGIANAMFTSVIERTKEIGILKAIGASNGEIQEIFIIESGLIGLVGGGIGILIGVVISLALNQFGVPSLISLPLLAFAIFFSILVGIVSGYFPAKRAARLQPVDALRYE